MFDTFGEAAEQRPCKCKQVRLYSCFFTRVVSLYHQNMQSVVCSSCFFRFFYRILTFRRNKQNNSDHVHLRQSNVYFYLFFDDRNLTFCQVEIFNSPLWRQFLRLDRHTCRDYNFISAQYPSFFNIVSLFLSTIFV